MTTNTYISRIAENDKNGVSRAIRIAILFQIVLGAYLQIVEWMPLGRWNNVANGNGQWQLDVIIAISQIVILIFFWRRWRRLMIAGVAVYAWWAWLEIQSWWIPYFFGASPQWMNVYNRWFAHTWKFLPAIKNHPIPDAEHTVLLALIACALVAGIRATIACFRTRRIAAAGAHEPRPSAS